jgi:hypothetical protein
MHDAATNNIFDLCSLFDWHEEQLQGAMAKYASGHTSTMMWKSTFQSQTVGGQTGWQTMKPYALAL